MQTDYIKTKSLIAKKALEIASDLEHIEQQMDELYKVNAWLMRRYRDDLIREFGIDTKPEMPKEAEAFASMFAGVQIDMDAVSDYMATFRIMKSIKDIMNKEMPEPWYCYGFGGMSS
jgi:hypothetical protein